MNKVLHVSEFNYITLPMKNVQFGPMVNLFQLPITDYTSGIFALWTVWVLSLISFIISPAGFMHFKPLGAKRQFSRSLCNFPPLHS